MIEIPLKNLKAVGLLNLIQILQEPLLLLLEAVFFRQELPHEEDTHIHGGDAADAGGTLRPGVPDIDYAGGLGVVLQILDQHSGVLILASLFICHSTCSSSFWIADT